MSEPFGGRSEAGIGFAATTASLLIALATFPADPSPRGALMIPALMANDAQRQGWEKTLWGAGLSGVGAYAITNLAVAAAVLLGWFG